MKRLWVVKLDNNVVGKCVRNLIKRNVVVWKHKNDIFREGLHLCLKSINRFYSFFSLSEIVTVHSIHVRTTNTLQLFNALFILLKVDIFTKFSYFFFLHKQFDWYIEF